MKSVSRKQWLAKNNRQPADLNKFSENFELVYQEFELGYQELDYANINDTLDFLNHTKYC